MIHLDTDCLIAVVTPTAKAYPSLIERLRVGEEFATSAIAWSEFLNGPFYGNQVKDASGIIQNRIFSFTQAEALVAADLFNRTGRRRGSKSDCFIGATAICARMPLVTENRKDFMRFVPFGLQLA